MHSQMRSLFLSLLIAVLLTGCAATSYKMLQVDSRMPVVNDSSGNAIVPCAEKKRGLESGNSCLALVRADKRFSRSRLNVREGECYRFEFLDNQAWYDATRRNSDANGEEGNWIMKMAKRNKNDPESSWFFLTPVVLDNDSDAVNIVKRVVGCGRSDTSRSECADWSKLSADESGSQSMVFETKEAEGHLAFYPNDAVFPDLPMQYYENNRGQVWVVINRDNPIVTAGPERLCTAAPHGRL